MNNIKLNILAIIPARGGSKGFPGKNIYPVNGKPLIAYTIKASLESKLITKTVVSSDDDSVLDVSKSFGSDVLKRPKQYATDEASSEVVVLDTIEQLKKKGQIFDLFVLLQPTSPLRDAGDIDSALQNILDHNANAIISVINIGVKPFKTYFLDKEGFLKGVHSNESPNMRRQDLPDAYLANGAIYCTYVKQFEKCKSFIPNGTIPYIMSNEKSVDVDSVLDIAELEQIMKKTLLK